MNAASASLDLNKLTIYLHLHGWDYERSRGDDAEVWSIRPEEADALPVKVLIPLERVFEEDDMLIDEAVGRIAAWERREVADLATDVANIDADTQSFRTAPPTESGVIPLDSGLKSLQAIHTMWKISGRRADEGPRPLYMGRGQSGPRVLAFLHQVDLLTTRPGSYIFTTRIRPEPELSVPRQQSLTGLDETPVPALLIFRYAVLAAFREELVHARDTASLLADGGSIADPSERGVSADFCKALADLGGEHRTQPVEISLNYAAETIDPGGTEQFAFTGGMVRALYEFGVKLERLARSGPGEIEGIVETLHGHHRIRISGRYRTDDEWQAGALWAAVDEMDYRLATEAHSRGKEVSATGEITLRAGKVELRVPSGSLHVNDEI